MSEINLVIIKGSDFCCRKLHFREIINVINNPEEFRKLLKNRQYLDAGYLILDFNSKTIINCQNAVSLPKTNFDELKII